LFGFAYDTARGRVVLHGGASLSQSETWEWDGSNWLRRVTPQIPPRRFDNSLAYDAVRGRMVMFGGSGNSLSMPSSDTWEYGPTHTAAMSPLGSGCPGSTGIPELTTTQDRLPWIGTPLPLQLTRVPSITMAILFIGAYNSTWNGVPLPLDLGTMGMPGCSLWVSGEILVPVAIAGGRGTATIPIPLDTALLSGRFFSQGFVIDPSANSVGISTSQGIACRFGGL
jgi:hypothetical protein